MLLQGRPMKRRKSGLEKAAAAVGMRLTREFSTAVLPAVRCTPAERARVEELSAARGMALAEHIRTRAIAELTPAELREIEKKKGGA